MFWRKLYHIIDLPIITNSTNVCTTYLHATISATSYISATYIAPSHLSYAQEAPWCGCWASPGSCPFPFLHFGWWMLRWWMPRYYWIGKAAGVLCEVRWIASRHQMTVYILLCTFQCSEERWMARLWYLEAILKLPSLRQCQTFHVSTCSTLNPLWALLLAVAVVADFATWFTWQSAKIEESQH